MKAKHKSLWQIAVVGVLMTFIIACLVLSPGAVRVKAQVGQNDEIRYNDDGPLPNGIAPRGGGVAVDADQTFTYDYRVIEANNMLRAPSYGNTDNTMTNLCAPMAGANVVGFYDRWYKQLMPDFEPGMMNGTAYYQYFPQMNFPAIKNTIRSLYTLMRTNIDAPGTSRAEFKSGLEAYGRNNGYTISYSSFLQNSTNVNLSTLYAALLSNKVGVIFCSEYNFIYSINHMSETETFLSKSNSTIGHMMMVYGYKTISYYKNGSVFRTDNYLYVDSGYPTAHQGFILMNEFLYMEDAVIVSVS